MDDGNLALLQLIVRAGDSGVTGAQTLQSVDLSSNGGVNDVVLRALARHAFDSLEELSVARCRGITDTGVGEVADCCPKLRKLHVWGCTQLTETFYAGHARADIGGADATAADATHGASKLVDLQTATGVAALAPLKIYGRSGDFYPAPDYD